MCGNSSSRLLLRLIADVVLLTAASCVALIVLPQSLTTVQRGFFCADDSLQFPYAKALLNNVHKTILVIALPAAVVLVVEMLRYASDTTTSTTTTPTSPQQFTFVGFQIPTFVSECYQIMGVYLFGLALQLSACQVTKHYVGRLRPYFFDVCAPQSVNGSAACDSNEYSTSGYIVDYSCSELAASPELLATVRLSFPSGYAASTAYAMCFVVFYLHARMQSAWMRLLRTALQFGCGVLMCLVALERVSTFRHHWTDVLAGVLLGFALAAFVCICVAQLFESVAVTQVAVAATKKPPRKFKRSKLKEDTEGMYGYYSVQRAWRR